jgi:methionine-rich copper-binding protein CopC
LIKEMTMNASSCMATAALLALATAAQAHTHLKDAQPADGSTLAAPPSHIVLEFSENTRLTALSIQKNQEQEQKITLLPAEAAAQISVPLPKLAPGHYLVSWRAVGKDNHVMAGKLHFTVSPTTARSPVTFARPQPS